MFAWFFYEGFNMLIKFIETLLFSPSFFLNLHLRGVSLVYSVLPVILLVIMSMVMWKLNTKEFGVDKVRMVRWITCGILYTLFFSYFILLGKEFLNEVFKTILNNGNGEVDTFTAVTTLIFLGTMIISGYFLFRIIIKIYKNKNA